MSGIVDTHFHIWDFDTRDTFTRTDGSFDWPDASLPKIHRNILAEEAEAELVKSGVEAAIFVQCLNRSMEEVRWVEKLAQKHKVIKGIVGGLDLTQDPEELRKQLRSSPLLVGVRHILDFEEENWLTRQEVHRGLQVVMEEGKVFDCLVRPPTLKHVATVASKFPSLRMIVDHISKPYISLGTTTGLAGWKEDMTRAAEQKNVFCKLSGLVTEADPENYATSWGPQTFRPYIEHCLQVFGADRCMFGSDWPVCKLAGAEHGQVVQLMQEILQQRGEEEKEMIWRKNAIRFYKLDM
eukprot:GFUD01019920.1.p1 GENE.GFUD01019920.1~~GFUD01019920.1.p1  ORF type:complete len:295 (+),score=100.16 GFUD01019920.1:181-1065(+)